MSGSAQTPRPSCCLTCRLTDGFRRYVQGNQLESLQGLENVPSLQVLNVSSSKLTSLAGLSACPQLQTLISSNNRLSSLSSVSELAYCPELSTLDVQSNSLDDPEVPKLAPGHCVGCLRVRCTDRSVSPAGTRSGQGAACCVRPVHQGQPISGNSKALPQDAGRQHAKVDLHG